MTYLIVIEAEGVTDPVYHHEPYRLASSLDEAKELMRDYMRHEDCQMLAPKFFVLHQELNGKFAFGEYYDPRTFEQADATTWLQATGRC